MKLEKREITLNERDSIKDTLYMQKLLLNELLCVLPQAERKQTREQLIVLLKENAEEVFLLSDLLKNSTEE